MYMYIYIIMRKGVSAPFLIFPLSFETCTPPPPSRRHLSRENTRFYDDTLESRRLKAIKCYLRYKTINSRNVPFDAQVKNFFV